MTNVFKVDNVILHFNTKCINIKNDTCAICRNNLLDKCITCAEKYNNNINCCDINNKCNKCISNNVECKSILGLCGHGYHECCINKWCKTRESCPLDNEEWLPINYI